MSGTHNWMFEPGDLLRDEMPGQNRMPGVGAGTSEPDYDYEVVKRVYDADGGDPLYVVDDPDHDQQVYKAKLLRANFEKVGEVDDE